ncbi:hypothetical protein CPC16_000563 [Podila verticillata]|nr:hypothetical protein BGZ59_001256 [Podila verticillata]KAF9375700.1 hypothetical protein CPC16_000563 [Podila verticillata]KAI9232565.1 MAG: hypothetical protein BYD32DRAFT_491143 [Podila humilis]KFH68974.1 hypothetical protein MVEG_05776 [Podila verticillata NRRL 6337]
MPMYDTPKTSWEWLEHGMDPRLGPVSREYGLMFDPRAMGEARVVLPDSWLRLWKELPKHFINRRLRDLFIHEWLHEMETLNVDAIHAECCDDPHAFIKTKSIVFCIAQACIDFDRVISQEMPEPEPLPDQVQSAMNRFAEFCHCPDYCTLADMSLTASILMNEDTDLLNCTLDDLKLICPVNNAPTYEEEVRNDLEPARIRGQAENRFNSTPTMMEYRVSDLVDIVANTQRAIYDYRESSSSKEQDQLVVEILHQIARAKASFKRLWKGFALLSRKTVDPVVWHRDIVKYTSGYGGHLGLSGTQTPCVHLIDAFLGRKTFATEMGKTSLKAFQQTQYNHQCFILSVANGPQLRSFAEECSAQRTDHPVAAAFNDLVDSYTRGFLAMHKGRAIEFAKVGFTEAGPREFSAKTEYEWLATENVVSKLKRVFDEAIRERDQIKLDK